MVGHTAFKKYDTPGIMEYMSALTIIVCWINKTLYQKSWEWHPAEQICITCYTKQANMKSVHSTHMSNIGIGWLMHFHKEN